jgi:arylsulfatase A-like enzyme
MIWDTPMLAANDYNYTRGFDGLHFVQGQKSDPWITDPFPDLKLPAQPHKIYSISSLDSYLRNHHTRKYEREYCVGHTISTAMDWLETNHTRGPFFLCLDMWDPHEPFDCPAYDYQLYANPDYDGDRMIYPVYGRPSYMTPEEQEHLRALYAGNVTLADRWLGNLFDLIDRLGLFQNTLVIWGSDHGHLFGEHDLQGKPGAELGSLYEISTRIPLMVSSPSGEGSGQTISGLAQPPDILPTLLEFLGLPIQKSVEGQSLWPLVSGGPTLRDLAFTSRFPPAAGQATYTPVEGALFDGWVGSDRNVEPTTITDTEWAFLCAPQGMTSELYHLPTDPDQTDNVIDQHPEIAEGRRAAWVDFLKSRNAPESRIRPFVDANVDVHTPTSGQLFAFRDDHSQWVAFATEEEALLRAHRDDAPGPRRVIEKITFGAILDDNPKNLVLLNGQYYWAQDLA